MNAFLLPSPAPSSVLQEQTEGQVYAETGTGGTDTTGGPGREGKPPTGVKPGSITTSCDLEDGEERLAHRSG